MAGVRADAAGFETRISDVTFGVADLTPDDDLAATYTYVLTSSDYRAALYGPGELVQEVTDTGAGANPVAHAFASGPSNVAVAANGMPGEFSLQGTTLYNLGVGGGAAASANQTYQFTLSAYSVLSVSGLLEQEFTGQTGASDVAIVFSSPVVADRGGAVQFLSPSNAAAAHAREFSLAYANPSDEAITVNLMFDASAYSFVSAVPEPSTYALLGLGLLALGAVARRRKA